MTDKRVSIGAITPVGKEVKRPAADIVEKKRDNRGTIRALVGMPVSLKFRHFDDIFSGQVANISRGGMFVPMQDPVDIGTEIDLELSVDNGELLLHAKAKVVRQQRNRYGTGVGVQFTSISYEAQTLIDAIIDNEEQFLGRYRLDRLAGRGGMAEVYQAVVQEGTHTGRVVAIKRIRPELAQDRELLDMFQRESMLLRNLKHPGIVEVFDAGTINGTCFIAMDFVEGCSLEPILVHAQGSNVPLPIDFACYLAKTVADTLDYAHNATDASGKALGLVHRDVAPCNIFISDAGHILLGDFGVAALAQMDTRGELAGKLSRMSPEQLKRRRVTAASDVYALGTILYEMLTNEPPFLGDTERQTKKMVKAGMRHAPSHYRPEIPEELDRVVAKALSPRFEHHRDDGLLGRLAERFEDKTAPLRYSTAKEFAADLEELYDPQIGDQMAIASLVRNLGLGRVEARRVRSTDSGEA